MTTRYYAIKRAHALVAKARRVYVYQHVTEKGLRYTVATRRNGCEPWLTVYTRKAS